MGAFFVHVEYSCVASRPPPLFLSAYPADHHDENVVMAENADGGVTTR